MLVMNDSDERASSALGRSTEFSTSWRLLQLIRDLSNNSSQCGHIPGSLTTDVTSPAMQPRPLHVEVEEPEAAGRDDLEEPHKGAAITQRL